MSIPQDDLDQLRADQRLVDDATLRALSRKLFQCLPMIRAFDDDYEEAVRLLRAVYNAGRGRGAYEASAGPRC